MSIRDSIREYISDNILFDEAGFKYSDEASFIQEGIVDSVGVMDLVEFVGKRFGIQVDPQDITPENFDSVARLDRYITKKMEVSASPSLGSSD
jgi:acyl carrier protein